MVKELFFDVRNTASKLDGICNKIRSVEGTDIKEIIDAKSSGTYGSEYAWNALYPNYSPATTLNEENSWFSYKFIKHRIYLTNYSIKVYYSSYAHWPRKWEVYGSNKNSGWKLIDSQDTMIFKDFAQFETFQCKYPGAYSKIKIIQTGRNSINSTYFRIQQIDFFGTLFPQSIVMFSDSIGKSNIRAKSLMFNNRKHDIKT